MRLMIRPGALGAMFLVFAGTVLPAAAEDVRPAKPEITWSVMHPTAIDVAYMKRVVEKAKEYGGVDSFEACGDCHALYGGINGLSMLEPYPHARAKIDPRKVEKARADLNAICELAHSIGKPLYYWHREVILAKGILEDRPEMLDENGEFDLLGKAYQDYLRFKIREAFRYCPKLDGVVLTLTEADYSVIHSAHPEKYPPQRVVEELVGLFAEEHERAGKRFILRSFGSNSQDYTDIIGGARRAAAKHAFEIETKVTEADFVPWLPKNPFLRKSEPLRLGVECDALGEYLGAGYLPAAQVDRIREYVGYGREEGADRYVIRIDRVGNSIFDSAHEVNLYAYMRFIADPSVRSDQVVAEYAARRFGDAAREMAPIMKGELEMVRNIHYIASNLTFHSFPLKPDMKWLKAGGIYSVYRENADLSGTKDIWSILSWMRTPSHAQILAEKDAGFALATNALASVERLKGRMPADEYERQHRAFATAVLAARALRAYTRCVVAYFEDMAGRRDEPVRLNRAADAAVAEIESMMTDVGDTFTGAGSYFATAGGNLDRVYFVGLRFYCRELVREYRLERAMRRKLERPDVYDFVIPGGIYDDNRTIRTMHGAHASAGSDRVVRYAGNDVFPNGTITVRLNAPKDARITVETDPAGASDYSLSKTWSGGVWTVVIGKKGLGYPGVLSVAAVLSWPEPTSTMKPWVYNWWMANAVDEAGLEYQCEELEAKGFGGFHVIPIYGAKGYEKQWRTLLSPEWVEAWNMAAETAARHGLGIDLTMGSGWCFGGPWVTAEDAASSGVRVKRPCPGGEGPMIDPFSPKAMSNHVARFEALFGKGGTARRPRAFYNDSYENDGARPKDGRDPVESQIACFKVWTDWCRRNGYISRNEAHGAPTNWLDLYALADIPETEMFGSGVGRDILVSKFASSAAHVTGRRLVAAEGCTWIDEHFCERPGDIKVEVDELFLAGVNHFFFHGLCYSPVGVAWPGWCFYASTQMNPRNPIWREVGALTAYITRCQSVFQTWTCDNDLLVLFDPKYTGEQMCIDDASRWFYSADGIGSRARELFEAGYQFDYVSPRMIAANPSLTNRLDVARARKSPFGGLDGVCSLRFRKGDETLYFVVTRKHPLEIAAERPFAVMDPMTGEIGGRSAWRLEKGASCFIRPDGAVKVALGREDDLTDRKDVALNVTSAGWSVEAACGGPALPSATNITRLVSWTAWDESFSGTMRYSCTFDAPRNAGAIDLGDVREIARVRVNGRDLGCRFMAPYRFPLPDGLLGERGNRLEVEVTNLGGNRLRWCDLNGVKWKYFTNINMVGLDYKPLDAGRWKVLPSGLLGPVMLGR